MFPCDVHIIVSVFKAALSGGLKITAIQWLCVFLALSLTQEISLHLVIITCNKNVEFPRNLCNIMWRNILKLLPYLPPRLFMKWCVFTSERCLWMLLICPFYSPVNNIKHKMFDDFIIPCLLLFLCKHFETVFELF